MIHCCDCAVEEAPLRPEKEGMAPLPTETWGRRAIYVHFLAVNAFFKIKGFGPALAIGGAQDAFLIGGSVRADWVGGEFGMPRSGVIAFSDVLASKVNAAAYVVDSMEVREREPLEGIVMRIGRFQERSDQDGGSCGLEYQEIAYRGDYLIQWADTIG
jgi:hypothetical protein